MKRIGLIAGEGMLPVVWAQATKEQGVQLVTIGITSDTEEEVLKKYSDSYFSISVGQLNQIIKTLKNEQITQAVMMGKVQKTQLYQGLKIDQRLMNLLANLKERNDDAILLALVEEFTQEGIEFINQTTYMDSFLAQEGSLIPELELTDNLIEDMKFGFKMAKEIGRLDIGQTVVVKDKAVIAVEAIEGTDQAILRSGDLAHEVVVCKVSKPQQDYRFDIPTIGLTTMKNLVQVGAKGLVVEADQTFFIQQDEVLKLAKENGIVVYAMR
ncbi:MAG: UDP-2,3-diacylglucosamine diphosphatase LpxI [Halanaerobiales bacterium]|nr:UDP-2,3-diacylglucosamine diphosphatase LpxI [Halanaerobiales bacterium]